MLLPLDELDAEVSADISLLLPLEDLDPEFEERVVLELGPEVVMVLRCYIDWRSFIMRFEQVMGNYFYLIAFV